MVIHQGRISPQSQLFQYGPGDPLYPASKLQPWIHIGKYFQRTIVNI